MQAITTYDIRGARQGGDVERLIEGMGLEQFAARVARIDAPAPAVVIDRAAARAALDASEEWLAVAARRGEPCAVAFGHACGALNLALRIGLIDVEEHERRSQRADELFLPRGR